jgi:hypothetical protein
MLYHNTKNKEYNNTAVSILQSKNFSELYGSLFDFF